MIRKIIFLTAIWLLSLTTFEAQSILYAYPTFKKRFETATSTYCVNNGGGCGVNAAFQGANLGSYVIGSNILRLGSIQTKVNRCSGQTASAVTAYYRVYATDAGPGSLVFTTVALSKGTTTANACGGTDENWAATLKSADGESLATNFNTGSYTLEMYYAVTTSAGAVLLNNGGANYKANFTIVPDTTWNGTAWSSGKPSLQSNAIIASNFNMTGESLSVNNLTVNSGVTLSLQSDRSFKVNGNVVNNGTILVNNNASYLLVDGSVRTGTGKVIVKRQANLKKNDYNYWSSPVSGQNLFGFSVGTPTNYFTFYHEPTDTFKRTGLDANSTFAAGMGYAIRGKDSYSTTLQETDMFTFEGVDNNGNITVNLQRSPGADKGYNLVGNPYPSNISFTNLYNYGNNRNAILNKQWFWTTLNDVTTQQGSNYAGNNYATFVSGVGGVGPSYVSGDIEEPSLRPLGFTKIGQGFLVQARANNVPLTFTNSIRSSNTADSIFFNKSENDKGGDGGEGDGDEEPQAIIDRYWLKFVNPNNIANTILIAHVPYATDDYDEDYDANMFSVGNDAFYSIVDPYKLHIQARKSPISNSTAIGLGYVSSLAGNAIIALDDKEGVFKNNLKAIYLKDNQTGSVTNLQNGYYTFATAKGANESRFTILYENNFLATQNNAWKEVQVYKDKNELVIRGDSNINSVDLFDASGKLVRHMSGKNSKDLRVDTAEFIKGFYIMKITSEKGITTKKVIL